MTGRHCCAGTPRSFHATSHVTINFRLFGFHGESPEFPNHYHSSEHIRGEASRQIMQFLSSKKSLSILGRVLSWACAEAERALDSAIPYVCSVTSSPWLTAIRTTRLLGRSDFFVFLRLFRLTGAIPDPLVPKRPTFLNKGKFNSGP